MKRCCALPGLVIALLWHASPHFAQPDKIPDGSPLAFLTTQTNLANLQAAESQHMSKAINPRLQRRDEKLNEQLIPIYDPTRRLFLASEDPSPVDPEATWQTMKINMQFGIVTINEARDAQGLPPVPWGDKPWLPDNRVQPKIRTDAKLTRRFRDSAKCKQTWQGRGRRGLL